MLTCQQFTELVTDYLEGRLSFWQRVNFQFHLGFCWPCRVYLNQMRVTIRAVGKIPPEEIPEDLKDELLRRFHRMSPSAPGED